MERIAVIGSGLMGVGIAQIFAAAGHSVMLMDSDASRLPGVPARLEASLNEMEAGGVTFSAPITEIVVRIGTTASLEDACEGADVVIEAVYEDMALKQRLFAHLDALCPPQVLLCSNTSAMSITEIASQSQHRGRIVGTHFWNPPQLIPLVEVIKAADTSTGALERTFALLERVGKRPIRVQKDVPGFVANRLQHALWREAFALIDEGVCDAETVDEAVKSGPGLRWPVLGPVENADLVGLTLTRNIHTYLLPHLNASPDPSPALLAHLERGELGFSTLQGFRTWTPESIVETRARLNRHLLNHQAEQHASPPRPDLVPSSVH